MNFIKSIRPNLIAPQLATNSSDIPFQGFCCSIILATALLMSTGCDSTDKDPLQQSIPTDSEHWQDKLEGTLQHLSEEDRQLLSRYMQRIKVSQANEQGAMPRITIAKAIEQQRKYEELHPQDPIGTKRSLEKSIQQDFSVSLLPVDSNEIDTLNNVKLTFILTNNGDESISSFKGTLLLNYPQFKKPKPVVIALTHFNPPIGTNHSTKIIAETNITDSNVMNAIKNPHDIEITIPKGRMVLEGGREVIFE